MSNIRVENLSGKYIVDAYLVRRIAEETLRVLKRPGARLEFLFLDDKDIRKLNKKYKGSDRPTDVLSFELDDVGSIAISLDRAKANSAIFDTEFAEEVARYVIHGILHLFGYDDCNKKKQGIMHQKETEILASLWIKENLLKVLTPR